MAEEDNLALHYIAPHRTYKATLKPRQRQRRQSDPEIQVPPDLVANRDGRGIGFSPMRERPKMRFSGLTQVELEQVENKFLDDFCPDQDVLPSLLPSPPKGPKKGNARRQSLDTHLALKSNLTPERAMRAPESRDKTPRLSRLNSLPSGKQIEELKKSCEKPIPKKNPKTLFDAAAQGRSDLIEKLSKKRDINSKENGNTPLMLASQAGDTPTVKELLKHGADPTLLHEKSGRSCVHLACLKGHLPVLKILLDSMPTFKRNTILEHQDSYGLAPLFLSKLGVEDRHREVANFLEKQASNKHIEAGTASGSPAPSDAKSTHSQELEDKVRDVVMVATADIKFKRNIPPEGKSKHFWKRMIGPAKRSRDGAALREELVKELDKSSNSGMSTLSRTLSGLSNPDVTQAIFEATTGR